ncbi:MAG: pyridoxal-phosphate dependent enzyme [Deltaproteobacteria bacterium]|nr:pyridoxal-phosphate dependent enzyme [Deltaproteobacteria bacterium]
MLLSSILDKIGNTPLVRIRDVANHLPQVRSGKVKIYAKVEYFNPGGSVKDRPACRMIQEGLKSGKLTRWKVILDSTSGNTGVAYALIAAAQGLKCELVMPENVSRQRKQIINRFGAKIIYSSPMEGSDGAILMAREILKKNPEKYFMPDQYNNEFNPRAHYDTTGEEIWRQTDGKVTHFVAGVGTGGTIMGVGRRLKNYNRNIKVIAIEPDDPLHGLEGLKHIASSIRPGIYKEEELDAKIPTETEPAYDMAERLAREEGMIVGHSSGGAMTGAIQIARKLDEGVVVTVFPDHGDRYFTMLDLEGDFHA